MPAPTIWLVTMRCGERVGWYAVRAYGPDEAEAFAAEDSRKNMDDPWTVDRNAGMHFSNASKHQKMMAFYLDATKELA